MRHAIGELRADQTPGRRGIESREPTQGRKDTHGWT